MPRILLLAGIVAGLSGCTASKRSESRPAAPRITLPADDGRHDEPVEWWYWTGHLSTAEGRRFGFQVTFFLYDGTLLVDHAALSDLAGGRLHDVQGFAPLTAELPGDRIELSRGGTRARGAGGNHLLAATFEGGGFALTASPGRGVVLHHGDGFQRYPFGGHTHYYSRPRMPVTGTVTLGESEFPVTGTAWFDHQWGDLRPAARAGWDWFGIQLDDGRSLMLFVAHPSGQPTFVDATLVDAGGKAVRVEPAGIEVESVGQWISPESGCTYPLGWRMRAGDLRLTVTPAFPAQEIYVTANRTASYWEGVALVSGSATGRAYAELAGYCSTP